MSLSASPPAAARPELLGRKRNLRLSADLEADVDRTAAAAGLASSEWIRRVIVASLSSAPIAALPAVGASPAEIGTDRRIALRVPAGDLSRWEAEAFDHGLNLTRYVRLQMSVTPDRTRRVATAIEGLSAASVEMARIGRNLNQIARSWNTFPGQSTVKQREQLADTCVAVNLFADQITAVCGELNQKLGRRRRKPGTVKAEGVTS